MKSRPLDPPEIGIWPWLGLGIGLLIGGAAVVYTATHYDELPARIPSHFNLAGEADGFSARSWGQVLILPGMATLMPLILVGLAMLIGIGKMPMNTSGPPLSPRAEAGMRALMARFLTGLAVLIAAMLGCGAIGAIDVALGIRERMPPWFLILGGIVLLYSLGSIPLFVLQGAKLRKTYPREDA